MKVFLVAILTLLSTASFANDGIESPTTQMKKIINNCKIETVNASYNATSSRSTFHSKKEYLCNSKIKINNDTTTEFNDNHVFSYGVTKITVNGKHFPATEAQLAMINNHLKAIDDYQRKKSVLKQKRQDALTEQNNNKKRILLLTTL
jgi:hypothetical protein